jgi:enediyne biosynthesis protein E4
LTPPRPPADTPCHVATKLPIVLLLLLAACTPPAVDDDDAHDDDDAGPNDDDTADDDDATAADDDDATLPPGEYFELWTELSGVGETPPDGCSIAVADINGDGWPDFYASQFGPNQLLYINQGDGTFVESAAEWGVVGNGNPTFGAAFADYDDDGDADLFVLNIGRNLIMRNIGDRFIDVTSETALAGEDDENGNSIAFADFDGDGDLDAWLTNGEDEFDPDNPIVNAPDKLYRQDDGVFVDLSDMLPYDNRKGAGFVGGWSDFDHDGDPDVYVVNDFGNIITNQMYRNDGPSSTEEWGFTVVTDTCNCALTDAGMGLAIGDFDRDGWQDMYTSNGALESQNVIVGERMLKNDGNLSFIDVTLAVGATAADIVTRESSWGLEFLDVDNDGWLDAFIPFGRDQTPEPDALMMNNQGVMELQENAGVESTNWGNGVGVVDFDLDGCLDLVVSSRYGTGLQLYRNRCTWGNHWLQVELRGTTDNRDAVGAVAIATVNGLSLREEVMAGSTSAHSSRWKTLHFGLGASDSVPELQITWPNGDVETHQNVAGDQRLILTQGE